MARKPETERWALALQAHEKEAHKKNAVEQKAMEEEIADRSHKAALLFAHGLAVARGAERSTPIQKNIEEKRRMRRLALAQARARAARRRRQTALHRAEDFEQKSLEQKPIEQKVPTHGVFSRQQAGSHKSSKDSVRKYVDQPKRAFKKRPV